MKLQQYQPASISPISTSAVTERQSEAASVSEQCRCPNMCNVHNLLYIQQNTENVISVAPIASSNSRTESSESNPVVEEQPCSLTPKCNCPNLCPVHSLLFSKPVKSSIQRPRILSRSSQFSDIASKPSHSSATHSLSVAEQDEATTSRMESQCNCPNLCKIHSLLYTQQNLLNKQPQKNMSSDFPTTIAPVHLNLSRLPSRSTQVAEQQAGTSGTVTSRCNCPNWCEAHSAFSARKITSDKRSQMCAVSPGPSTSITLTQQNILNIEPQIDMSSGYSAPIELTSNPSSQASTSTSATEQYEATTSTLTRQCNCPNICEIHSLLSTQQNVLNWTPQLAISSGYSAPTEVTPSSQDSSSVPEQQAAILLIPQCSCPNRCIIHSGFNLQQNAIYETPRISSGPSAASPTSSSQLSTSTSMAEQQAVAVFSVTPIWYVQPHALNMRPQTSVSSVSDAPIVIVPNSLPEPSNSSAVVAQRAASKNTQNASCKCPNFCRVHNELSVQQITSNKKQQNGASSSHSTLHSIAPQSAARANTQPTVSISTRTPKSHYSTARNRLYKKDAVNTRVEGILPQQKSARSMQQNPPEPHASSSTSSSSDSSSESASGDEELSRIRKQSSSLLRRLRHAFPNLSALRDKSASTYFLHNPAKREIVGQIESKGSVCAFAISNYRETCHKSKEKHRPRAREHLTESASSQEPTVLLQRLRIPKNYVSIRLARKDRRRKREHDSRLVIETPSEKRPKVLLLRGVFADDKNKTGKN